MRLIREDVRGVARENQRLMDEKRASEKELKGFEAPVSGNGWQFPVREEKMSFFSVENAVLITVYQIVIL